MTPPDKLLDDQTRARIRAEEEYRAQVRAELPRNSRERGLGRSVAALLLGLLLLLLLGAGMWFLSQPVEDSGENAAPVTTSAPSSSAQP